MLMHMPSRYVLMKHQQLLKFNTSVLRNKFQLSLISKEQALISLVL